MRLILPISLTAPTQPGYDFIGWTKESGNSNLNGNDIVIGTENTIIVANWEKKYIYYSELVLDYKCSNVSAGSSPYIIEYDGECELINDEGDNWVMKLLGDASTHAGTHTFKISSRISIDIFLVGGGGGGGPTNSGYTAYGGGGGGGYTLTATEKLSSYTHSIQIGDGGGVGLDGESTSGFNYTVSGGVNGQNVTQMYNN